MRFDVVKDCPLCHKSYNFYHALITGSGLHYRVCECGLFYQLWAMAPETLAEYYKNQYRSDKGSSEVTNNNIEEEIIRADKIIQFLDSEINPNNVLDIGSSTGMLLEKLQDVYKCQVIGIEPGDNFREYSHGRGLNVLSRIEHLDGSQKFDLITIIHVLEHLVEPIPFLEKVRGLLADGGKLIVEVPLLMYCIEHPILFTEETLRMMLNKTGFTVERLVIDKHLTTEARLDT